MTVDLALSKSAAAGELSEREAEEALKQVAERLVGCARATDTIARIDREKFAMILEDLDLPGARRAGEEQSRSGVGRARHAGGARRTRRFEREPAVLPDLQAV